MSPYEIAQLGGSVEHWNDEAGEVWMRRLTGHFRRSAWLNPLPEAAWGGTRSIGMLRTLLEGRMHPLSLDGIEAMARSLR